MAVQAKFFVREITRYAHSRDQVKVSLSPVTRGEGNKEWASATPSGEIVMQISNPDASGQFDVGDEWTVTFDLVD